MLVLGVTYKRDIEDVRESPGLDIIKILEGKGARVSYNDPYVARAAARSQPGRDAAPQDLMPCRARAPTVVVIVTDHSSYRYRGTSWKRRPSSSTRGTPPRASAPRRSSRSEAAEVNLPNALTVLRIFLVPVLVVVLLTRARTDEA